MKFNKILPMISLVSVLAGCTLPEKTANKINENWYKKVYHPYVQTRRDIKYLAEPPCQDKWQTPYETKQLGTGDCEDFALYLENKWRKEKLTSRLVFGRSAKGVHDFHTWSNVYWGWKTWVVDSSSREGFFVLKEKVPEGIYIEKRVKCFEKKLKEYREDRKYYAGESIVGSENKPR